MILFAATLPCCSNWGVCSSTPKALRRFGAGANEARSWSLLEIAEDDQDELDRELEQAQQKRLLSFSGEKPVRCYGRVFRFGACANRAETRIAQSGPEIIRLAECRGKSRVR